MSHPPSTGPNASGDGGESGPRADGAAALLLGKRCADDGEAAGSEQRGADALDRAGVDELMDILREAAGGGGDREDGDAHDENPTPAEEVAGRATDENECAEEEAVGFDDPLDVDDGGIEGGLKRGQGDVDDGAVDEGHAAAEDGGGEDPGGRGGADGGYVGGGRHVWLWMRRAGEGFGLLAGLRTQRLLSAPAGLWVVSAEFPALTRWANEFRPSGLGREIFGTFARQLRDIKADRREGQVTPSGRSSPLSRGRDALATAGRMPALPRADAGATGG